MKFPKQGVDLKKSLEAFERSLLIQSLKAAHGKVTHAARLLNVSRQTVYNLLKKHDLKPERSAGLN